MDTAVHTLTRETILALSGKPLAEAVAEYVMGWTRTNKTDATGSLWADAAGKWHLIPDPRLRDQARTLMGIVAEIWEPHADMRAACAVEKRFDDQPWRYVQSLACIIWNKRGSVGDFDAQDVFYLLSASPEQRCRAALLTTLPAGDFPP